MWQMNLRLLLPAAPALLLVAAWAADRAGLTPDCAQQPVGERIWTVTRVIDGDTLEDACGRRIRVLNVDTPERDTPDGPSATAFTRCWLGPLPATAEIDICPTSPRDRYGRVLARVHRVTDDTDLSSALLANGLAWPMFIPPCATANVTTDTATYEQARRHRIGLWAHHTTEPVPPRIALAQQYPPFVMVSGRVQRIDTHKRYITLIVGRGPHTLQIRIGRRSLPRFAEAGIDIERLRGGRVVAMGKLYRPERGQPYLYVDYPQLLRAPSPDSGQ
ncbi:MAG: hypothetical protein D6761_11830 [Candidatus Dadabacteria bacterium]|nr:MAG: hypothetical protein D6761_11830 [Candidatus Dadabacteria bacterium]